MNCYSDLDIEIGGDQDVVVNALFNPDSVWTFTLSQSRTILEGRDLPFEIIDNAFISIFDENDVLVESLFASSQNGVYIGETFPEIGSKYSISIDYDSKEYQSTSYTPELPLLKSASGIFQPEALDFHIEFVDKKGEENYYQLFLIDVDGNGGIEFEVIDPVYENNISGEFDLLFDDKLIDGNTVSIRLTLGNRFSRFPHEAVLISCSEEYYNYFASRNLQQNLEKDPFAQPVQVYSNIINGLGIFGGFSITRREIEYIRP